MNIKLKDEANSDITVYNTLGNSVFKSMYSGSEIKLDLKDLTAGVYFINALQKGKNQIQKIIIADKRIVELSLLNLQVHLSQFICICMHAWT